MSYGPPPPGGGYGQPAYGAPLQPAKTSPLAITSLVTGILGATCCSGYFVMSVAAVVTGAIGQRQIAESGGLLKGGGMAKAGLILGIVGLVIAVLYWVLVATGTIHPGRVPA